MFIHPLPFSLVTDACQWQNMNSNHWHWTRFYSLFMTGCTNEMEKQIRMRKTTSIFNILSTFSLWNVYRIIYVRVYLCLYLCVLLNSSMYIKNCPFIYIYVYTWFFATIYIKWLFDLQIRATSLCKCVYVTLRGMLLRKWLLCLYAWSSIREFPWPDSFRH